MPFANMLAALESERNRLLDELSTLHRKLAEIAQQFAYEQNLAQNVDAELARTESAVDADRVYRESLRAEVEQLSLEAQRLQERLNG